MENKYTAEWQPYDYDYGYDKQEYDIKVYTGEVYYNCYPNAESFTSFNEKTNGRNISEMNVIKIRLSENPVLDIND